MSKKIDDALSGYTNERSILEAQEQKTKILAEMAGEEYTPDPIPKSGYTVSKRMRESMQKENEFLEAIADGAGTISGANKLAIDYGTDILSLKKGDEPIANSGVTLPAYGLSYDSSTGGLTLTKNGSGMQGQTVSIPDYGSPLCASSAAGMTETDKVYVYTGETSASLTNGHWYYYDGDSWEDGGTYNSQGIDTDTTLLVSGAPADAKAAGDAVADLKTHLSVLIENTSFTGGVDYNVILSSETGKWYASDNYTTIFYPVPDGTTKVTVTANSDKNAVIALLRSDSHANNTYPDYATGQDRISVTAGSTITIDVPSDCHYAAVLKTATGNNHYPSSLIVSKYVSASEIDGSIELLNSAIRSVEQKTGGTSENLHDANTDTVGKYWGADFTEETGSNYRHTALIDIEDYDKIRVTGNSSSSSGKFCYFVSEDQTQYQSYSMGAMSGTIIRPSWAKYVTLSAAKSNTGLAVYGIYTGTINGQIEDINSVINDTLYPLNNGSGKLTDLCPFQIGRWGQETSIHSSTSVAANVTPITFTHDTFMLCDLGYYFYNYYAYINGSWTLQQEDVCTVMFKANTSYRINICYIDERTISTTSEVTDHIKIIDVPTSDYEKYKHTFFGFEMYNKVAFVGDSYTMKRSTYNKCWGQIIGQRCGIDVSLFGHSGYNTNRFRTETGATDSLSGMLASAENDLYWISFGINDSSTYKSNPSYLGSISDISGSYTEYPNTFYGNYGCIIESIRSTFPNAKIVICTVMYHDMTTMQKSTATTNIPPINTAIKEIAEHYSIPCIDLMDDIFYKSPEYQNNMQETVKTHPDPILFPGMASANQRLFAKAVGDNPSYFKTLAT